MDTIHLRHRPLHALTRDICNWCQGPINHLVSKRPCNAFYISTYVESERVCHQCKPLLEEKGFLDAFPSLMPTICAIDLGGFTCHEGILPKWGEADTVISPKEYAWIEKSTKWINTNECQTCIFLQCFESVLLLACKHTLIRFICIKQGKNLSTPAGVMKSLFILILLMAFTVIQGFKFTEQLILVLFWPYISPLKANSSTSCCFLFRVGPLSWLYPASSMTIVTVRKQRRSLFLE